MTKIKCRHCGEEGSHLTVRCPQRSPDKRAKRWEDMLAQSDKKNEEKLFHCEVSIYQGKNTTACTDTVAEPWSEIQVPLDHSIHRDFSGILHKSSGLLLPPNHPNVEPGKCKAVGRTSYLTDEELYDVLDEAKEALIVERPLSPEKIEKVHAELLLLFNHFSLKHEGSQLGLDETEMITKLLAGKDSKRELEESEMKGIKGEVPESAHDITEAVNHILVPQKLQELANHEISETLILNLHSVVMDGLLVKTEEGLPGEYRKVPVNVMGDNTLQPSFCDIPPLMSHWCEKELVQRKDEHIIDYLARFHSRFQDIHPFRDGNGRVGRLIMNIILLKQGYPVLSFAPSLSVLFNQGVSNGLRENYSLFSRLLAEVLFARFQTYEQALGVKLLPSVEEIIQADHVPAPKQVTP